MIASALLALHLLCAVVWVGGMAFALLVLRPSLAVLQPAQRLALHGQVFARFFRIVWHAMPLLLLSGYAMLFGIFGGFAGVNGAVHLMHLAGLVMAAVFVAIFFGPWKQLQSALQAEQQDVAAASVGAIRTLIVVNLVLGLVTVAIAAFA
jgi:uncharacterized membrane protein